MVKKGQISTEYLVILAVVLIVALVVVGLLGWFPGVGGGTLETQSKTYWAGKTPLAITAYKISGTTVEMTLKNMLAEPVVLTGISFSGTDLTLASNVTLNAGEEETVTATLATPCGAAGTPYTYDVILTYSQGDISGMKEVGDKPLIGKCS